MKKTIFIFITLTSLMVFSFSANAQEVKSPLEPKETTNAIPASPGADWTWVKAHWNWDGGNYVWKRGMYVETRKGYSWMDGQWERNQKSGWWKYNSGYWLKEKESSDVKNDKNTAEDDKENKEQRHQNKTGGLYIKTGSSD